MPSNGWATALSRSRDNALASAASAAASLCHADIRSTLRYAHADDKDLLEALEMSAKNSGPATPNPERNSKPAARA
jgi:hypothetical protein